MLLFDVGDTLPKRKGHADQPGTGPAGETCKTCEHYARVRYHTLVHRKCALMEASWTHGPGSDIRASDPACRRWEPETEATK